MSIFSLPEYVAGENESILFRKRYPNVLFPEGTAYAIINYRNGGTKHFLLKKDGTQASVEKEKLFTEEELSDIESKALEVLAWSSALL